MDEPTEEQRRGWAAMDKMRRHDGVDYSTVWCDCGSSVTWGSGNELEQWLPDHIKHMEANEAPL